MQNQEKIKAAIAAYLEELAINGSVELRVDLAVDGLYAAIAPHLGAVEPVSVIKVEEESIEFSDGTVLQSDHDQDCCENHWLDFGNLLLKDFEGLFFDLSKDGFFNRVEGFGIELMPLKGWPVRVPGYGSNNGYYSANLSLVLSKDGKEYKRYDITECQEVND